MKLKPSTEKITAILLAAGLSRRMGEENKLLLPFGSSTILHSTIVQIQKACVEGVIVVIGHDQEKVREHIQGHDVRIALNQDYEIGLVSSIKCGITALNDNSSFMIALADMPLLTTRDYNVLIDFYLEKRRKGLRIVRPKSPTGQPGNPVLLHYSLQKALLANPDPESSKSVILRYKSDLAFYHTDQSSYFADIDSPDDYGKWSTSG